MSTNDHEFLNAYERDITALIASYQRARRWIDSALAAVLVALMCVMASSYPLMFDNGGLNLPVFVTGHLLWGAGLCMRYRFHVLRACAEVQEAQLRQAYPPYQVGQAIARVATTRAGKSL